MCSYLVPSVSMASPRNLSFMVSSFLTMLHLTLKLRLFVQIKGIEGDWRGLRGILTCRGFNTPQSLPTPLVKASNEQALMQMDRLPSLGFPHETISLSGFLFLDYAFCQSNAWATAQATKAWTKTYIRPTMIKN